jgi:LAO/AO transport system kinase
MDPGVFIRSLATRGHFGGLTHSTRSAIDVLDAMGKDYILVETVGVGQDEVDVVRTAHTTVIVVIPGMGDDIQAIKAGILEVGDIFLINKADREGSDKTLSDLRLMIEMDQKKYDEGGWKPPILKVEAVFDKGVDEFLDMVDQHAAYLAKTEGGLDFRGNKTKVTQELKEMIKARLIEEVLDRLTESGAFDKAVTSIVSGDTDPYTACEDLVLPVLSH